MEGLWPDVVPRALRMQNRRPPQFRVQRQVQELDSQTEDEKICRDSRLGELEFREFRVRVAVIAVIPAAGATDR